MTHFKSAAFGLALLALAGGPALAQDAMSKAPMAKGAMADDHMSTGAMSSGAMANDHMAKDCSKMSRAAKTKDAKCHKDTMAKAPMANDRAMKKAAPMKSDGAMAAH